MIYMDTIDTMNAAMKWSKIIDRKGFEAAVGYMYITGQNGTHQQCHQYLTEIMKYHAAVMSAHEEFLTSTGLKLK